MEAAHWVESNGRILLQAEDGRLVNVRAADVFAAAFRSADIVAGFRVPNPLEQLFPIEFSRIGAAPTIRLSGSVSTPRIERGVVASGNFAIAEADADQILLNNRWHPIDRRLVDEMEEWIRTQKLDLEKPGLREIILLRQLRDAPFQLVDEIRIHDSDEARTPAPLDLADLNAKLYPYQMDGVVFLKTVARQGVGCLLADEMGLGKTLQVIALLQSEQLDQQAPALVVTPATLLENWRREIARFTPHLRVLVHAGRERAGIPAILKAFNVVVTSYDIVVRDEPLLSQVHWNVVVLDEAQTVKNPDARRTAAVKALPRRVSVAVTGTPVENKLEDLWSICDFCLPGLLGQLPTFRGLFENNLRDADHLADVVAPIILRRKLADVATDLPERIEIPRPIAMSERMADAYEEIRKTALTSSGNVQLEALMRLRQLCAHPSLLLDWGIDNAQDMPKYELLLEVMEEVLARKQKALIFAGFQNVLDLVLNDFALRWPTHSFAVIDGRTPVENRQSIVDQFSTVNSGGALMLNPRAAGTGLNITSANHVIHFTPEWNPAVTAQASARSFRRGQTLPVTVHHFYFVDSIEEMIVERAAFKRDLADQAVKGHDGDADEASILEALQRSPLSSMRVAG